MPTYKTEEDLRAILKSRLRFGTTQTALAKELNVTLSSLNEVLNRKRGISAEIAGKIGFRQVFVKVRK